MSTHKSIEETKAEVTRCVLEAWREHKSVTGAVNEIMELINTYAQQQVQEAVEAERSRIHLELMKTESHSHPGEPGLYKAWHDIRNVLTQPQDGELSGNL